MENIKVFCKQKFFLFFFLTLEVLVNPDVLQALFYMLKYLHNIYNICIQVIKFTMQIYLIIEILFHVCF